MGCLKIFWVKVKKAYGLRQLTSFLSKCFLVLHFAAKKWLNHEMWWHRYSWLNSRNIMLSININEPKFCVIISGWIRIRYFLRFQSRKCCFFFNIGPGSDQSYPKSSKYCILKNVVACIKIVLYSYSSSCRAQRWIDWSNQTKQVNI